MTSWGSRSTPVGVCPLCLSSVPLYRSSLGLCPCHSRYYLRRNWKLSKEGRETLSVQDFLTQFKPRGVWTEERRKESGRNSMRRQYAANPKKFIERSQRWYRDNKAQALAAAKLYRMLNPDYVHRSNTIRSRRVRMAPGFCSVESWLSRVAYYGWKCVYCGKDLSKRTLTIDHRIPLSKGGSHWPSNLAPSCKPCNSRKKDKTK